MNKKLNVLSLFDGLSCGRIALERAGIEIENYYASEIDKYAIKVSEANYPDIIRLGDVTKVKIDKGRRVDLLIAGSPCQGFSFAGKQLNFEDPRSALFFEFVRLLKECRRYNPDVLFMLENVKMKKEHQDVISRLLGVEPIEINSALVSAQNRKRLYWTNITNVCQPEDTGLILDDIVELEVDPKYYISEKAKSRIIRKGYSQPKINPFKTGTLNTKNNSGQLSIDSGTTLIVSDRGSAGSYIVAKGKVPTLSARPGCSHDNHIRTAIIVANSDSKFEHRSRIYSTKGISPTLTAICGGDQVVKFEIDNNYRRLTPVECERLQNVPDNYTNSVSNSQRYKMLGNGWTVDVITHIFSHIRL